MLGLRKNKMTIHLGLLYVIYIVEKIHLHKPSSNTLYSNNLKVCYVYLVLDVQVNMSYLDRQQLQ